MSSKRKNNKQKTNNSSSASQKSLSLLKNLNKDMALNMQRLKEDLSNTIAQNLSLKGELYETLVDRNCLWERNMRLIELLRSLQAECFTFEKRINNLLSPRNMSSTTLSVETQRDFSNDMLNPETPKQWLPNPLSTESYPMQNDHFNRSNNFEPTILYSRKSPSTVYRHSHDGNNLSPITEEHCEDIVTSRLGRRSRLAQSTAPVRNSGCEDAFPSVKPSFERKLSGCIIFRNKDEPNKSATDEYKTVGGEEGAMDTNPSDVIGENMKSIEEGRSITSRASLMGRSSLAGKKSSLAGRKSSSLLTINIMQQQNDPQASPPVIMNILPRKRRYASKLSLNDEFLDIGFSEKTNKIEECKDFGTMNSKMPAVVLERIPLSPIVNENIPEKEPEISPVPVSEKRKSSKKSGRPSVTKYQNSTTRRSCRNRETLSYKD